MGIATLVVWALTISALVVGSALVAGIAGIAATVLVVVVGVMIFLVLLTPRRKPDLDTRVEKVPWAQYVILLAYVGMAMIVGLYVLRSPIGIPCCDAASSVSNAPGP